MTDTNQKLREALQAISDIDDSTNHAVDASAALDRIGQIARQALALPTAAPVGERYSVKHEITQGGYRLFTVTDSESQCSEDVFPDDNPVLYGLLTELGSRAALSAGDAVDAQRLDFIEKSARCDPKMDGQHVWWPTSLNKALKGPTLRAAIDAAMRKDKP